MNVVAWVRSLSARISLVLWGSRTVKDKSYGWQHKVSLWPGLGMARDDSAIGITAWGGGTVRGDGAETVLMSEGVSRHLFSKAFPSKMEDRPSQSLKPATNKSGCQTEKWQMQGYLRDLSASSTDSSWSKGNKRPLQKILYVEEVLFHLQHINIRKIIATSFFSY